MGKQHTQHKPWYKNGLYFECQRCGNCCRGEPGYVWVTAPEVQNIADYLKLSVSSFARKYLRRVNGWISLTERPDGDCVLYSNGCSVYKVRPTQCRTFPFWPSNLRSKRDWNALKDFCPGIDRGRFYAQEEIERILAEE